MIEERKVEVNTDDISHNRYITWIKKHKLQLLLAGVSVTTLIALIVGMKNEDAAKQLWESLKTKIEKGTKYTSKWFENATIEDLYEARRGIELDYGNPELDLDYRARCWDLLKVFDNEIGRKKWAGKEYGYPNVKDWHLLNDD